jgi:hypothetical protein
MAARLYSTRGNATTAVPMPGLVALWKSVGAGGANRSDDTDAVQTGLNAVPIPLGGPKAPLAVDGKVGPKTIAAIRRFQEYWTRVVDGRVDPGGPTVTALNTMAGVPLPHSPQQAKSTSTAPRPKPPPQRVQVAAGIAGAPASAPPHPTSGPPDLFQVNSAVMRMDLIRHEHLPALTHIMDRALPQLRQAQAYAHKLYRPPTGPGAEGWNARENPDRLCFLVCGKHLHLSESDPGFALEAIDQVLGLARVMRQTLTERQTATGAISDADDIYVALYRQPRNARQGAHTYAGGRWRRVGRDSGNVTVGIDGRPMPERLDRIYVAPLFDTLSRDTQRYILLHELLHYVGDLYGQAGAVLDFAYVWQPTYRTLPPRKRIRNTDCLALLLQDLSLGTAVTASAAMVDAKVVGRIPFVRTGGAMSVPPVTPGAKDHMAFPVKYPLPPEADP